MKYFLALFFLSFSTVIFCANGSDYWKNCPGPGCPAVTPNSEMESHRYWNNCPGPGCPPMEPSSETESDNLLKNMNILELNKKEQKLRQELEKINKAKQLNSTNDSDLKP
jgi:hypothetical protein